VDPESLPDCVVCYLDSTISLPLITAYALSRGPRRKPKRLYERRDEMLETIRREYFRRGSVEKITHRTEVGKKPRRHLAKRASSVGL
jgi:deoxyhypusine synthase